VQADADLLFSPETRHHATKMTVDWLETGSIPRHTPATVDIPQRTGRCRIKGSNVNDSTEGPVEQTADSQTTEPDHKTGTTIEDSVPAASEKTPRRAGDMLLIVGIVVVVAAIFWYDQSVKAERARENLRASYKEYMTEAIHQYFLITGTLPQSAKQVVEVRSFRTEKITDAVREVEGENYSSDEEMLRALEARAFVDATPVSSEQLSKWKQEEQKLAEEISSVPTDLERLQLAINPDVNLLASLRLVSILSRNGVDGGKLDAYLGTALKARSLLQQEVSDAALRQSLVDGMYSSADISDDLRTALKDFHVETGILLLDIKRVTPEQGQQMRTPGD
jgi:type II secretory pathway pseudopilin PulG